MKKPFEEVTIHQAKTHLSRLLQLVSRGKTILIKRGKQPIAQLVPIPSISKERVLGTEKGKIKISQDFDALPEAFEKYVAK